MKKMLIFEEEEKDILKKASALISEYCEEMGECEECPFDNLCNRIQNSDTELNVPETFFKVTDIIY